MDFNLPELGENVSSGDVLRLLVSPGDTIEKDQPVLELETEKATIEVPSSVAGTIKEIKVKAGDTVKVGQTILVVDEGAGKAAEPAAAPGKPRAEKPAGAPAKEAKKERQEEKEAGKKTEDRRRKTEETAPEKEEPPEKQEASEKEEAPAEAAAAEEPARGRRGEVVDIARGVRPAPDATETGPAMPPAPAAPSVRREARELGVDIADVPGSGPGDRITIEDVRSHARRIITGVTGGTAAGRPAPLPDFSRWGAIERQAMSAIRRTTAHHLTEAWDAIPHVTQFDRADITNLDLLRKRFEKSSPEAGGKPTVTAFAIQVVASALKVFPQFNASVDMAAEEIIYKKYVNIGVAVDTDRGLLVPVIRDAGAKGLIELSIELAAAAEKARARKLTLEEMQGGSFTITNLGGIGGTAFTPIINLPEVAILGLSRASLQPVFVNGRFEPRLVLPLSLSYDHRVIDGADAIRFLRWVAEALEQPYLLTLQK